MTQLPTSTEQDKQRSRAKKTALVVGLVAVSIYVAFILSGVLHK